jgi:hypothetical protein
MYMTANDGTTMVITGLYSGLTFGFNGTIGLFSRDTVFAGQSGYKISSATTDHGLQYNVVSVATDDAVTDPASVIIGLAYTQDTAFDEVDMDIRYTDIPTGSSLEVESTLAAYRISKQAIHGSSLLGKPGNDLGPINTALTVNLWIPNASQITSKSALTLSMTKIIESVTGGPVKKVLLQQIMTKLAPA